MLILFIGRKLMKIFDFKIIRKMFCFFLLKFFIIWLPCHLPSSIFVLQLSFIAVHHLAGDATTCPGACDDWPIHGEQPPSGADEPPHGDAK